MPLSEIGYESSGFSTAIVSLQFEEEVVFEISPSPDPREIVITVRHRGASTPVEPPVIARTYPYAINLASSPD